MNMKIFRLSNFLLAIAFAAGAFCFESRSVSGSAMGQNANSSTTMTENSNAGTTRRRRGRRRTPAPPAAGTTAVPATEAAATVAPVATTEQTDLSGTYAGTFDCADAGLTGDTTLTINGNQFTTSDGKSGRITAATTQGYTGVAMQFGEFTPGDERTTGYRTDHRFVACKKITRSTNANECSGSDACLFIYARRHKAHCA